MQVVCYTTDILFGRLIELYEYLAPINIYTSDVGGVIMRVQCLHHK